MGMPKYVYVVTEKTTQSKPVYVVNEETDIYPFHTLVYVINQLPKSEWPKKYGNVHVVNRQEITIHQGPLKGLSRYFDPLRPIDPQKSENIYIVNFEDFKETMPNFQVNPTPRELLLRCSKCGVEFLTKRRAPSASYDCPVCKNSFKNDNSYWARRIKFD
jgi:hypothetical protein